MEVRFVQRGTEIDDKLRGYMEGKVSKLEKFFRKILNSQVVVSLHKGNFNVETTANANGVILRAEENANDPRRAFDQALKNLERQIKRHNDYIFLTSAIAPPAVGLPATAEVCSRSSARHTPSGTRKKRPTIP